MHTTFCVSPAYIVRASLRFEKRPNFLINPRKKNIYIQILFFYRSFSNRSEVPYRGIRNKLKLSGVNKLIKLPALNIVEVLNFRPDENILEAMKSWPPGKDIKVGFFFFFYYLALFCVCV